ncbi:LIM zinc-binding domain-containing Nebulette-like isoform X2 [Cyprinus carpio]|uniref:LIM zinc-binding domain-containing Nebulette-like isoform X2 n=1 Tax=Cyprinus carpio TaxID=7962 RepID=A0A9Q9XUV9_CYPCA|nr:LIM zinc-binding domain-containing Nebulette-like isoform X2 [Cyprinus carpio]
MNAPCARCGKTVYPTEKISCLDKNWHKGCFHCEVCKMTLNMKNYKGYDKKPYCNAHYPKTSFTIVTDTPENLRLKQQSELQSQVKYHEEFERLRGRGATHTLDEQHMARLHGDQLMGAGDGYHGVQPQVVEMDHRSAGAAGVFQHHSHHAPQHQQGYAHMQAARSVRSPPHTRVYRALYDYAAHDHDEVSFRDGDVIVNAQPIDEGWMFGTVQRTGKSGMLPANYVECLH